MAATGVFGAAATAFEPLSDADLSRKAATRQPGWVTGVVNDTNEGEDLLYCTPQALMAVIETIIKAHEEMIGSERKTLSSEAAALLSPEVVQRIYTLRDEVREFM